MVIVGRRRKVRQARRRIVGRHHYGFILKIDILSCIRDTLFVPSKQRGPFLLSTTGSAPYVPTRSINDEECALIREARFFFIPPLRHVVCGRRHRIKYLINIPLPPHIHTHTSRHHDKPDGNKSIDKRARADLFIMFGPYTIIILI